MKQSGSIPIAGQRLVIPLLNAGGAFDSFDIDKNVKIERCTDSDMSRWRNDLYVQSWIPPARMDAISHQISFTTTSSRVPIYENIPAMERLYSLCALIGLRSNVHLEWIFSERRLIRANASPAEDVVLPGVLDNQFQGRLALTLNSFRTIALDMFLDDWTQNAYTGLKAKAFKPPATRYALNRWYLSLSRVTNEDALVDCFIGLESLFLRSNERNSWLMFGRLGQFAHDFLGFRRANVAQKLRAAYQMRNDVVHGDVAPPERLSKARAVAQQVLRAALLALLSNRDIDIEHNRLSKDFDAKVKPPKRPPKGMSQRRQL